MKPMNVSFYIEEKPEHYTGSMSVTIRCLPKERQYAELLLSAFTEVVNTFLHKQVAP